VSALQFDEITKKIDKHFEKTGVVLVGMHQELQEQKHRIGQYHEKVDAVTSDINRRRDEIVADIRTRAEVAVAVLDEIDPLVQRVRSVAQDADDAIKSAGEVLQRSTNNLSQSHNDFRVGAEDLIGTIERNIASFSSETKILLDRFAAQQTGALQSFQSEAAGQRDDFRSDIVVLIDATKDKISSLSSETKDLLKQFSEQQDQSITTSSTENRLALQAIVGEQAKFLASAQNAFHQSIAKLEVKISTHMDAHKRFLKSSYDELSERQHSGDKAFAALKIESERHQSQQIEFAKKTRLIIGALVVVGFAVVGVLAYGKGIFL
jgi:ABC-type transporter Mla subunit MlaD